MFQRLTSLFFSDSSLPEGLEEPKPFVSEEEEEDGWLVIDLGGEKSKVSPWFHVAAGGSCLSSTGQALSGNSRPCLGAFLLLSQGRFLPCHQQWWHSGLAGDAAPQLLSPQH